MKDQLEDQLEIRCQHNAALHVALRNAVDEVKDWKRKAIDVLMHTAYLPIEASHRYTVERTTCIDCGSKHGGWRNVTPAFKTPTYLRLCDSCCVAILKERT